MEQEEKIEETEETIELEESQEVENSAEENNKSNTKVTKRSPRDLFLAEFKDAWNSVGILYKVALALTLVGYVILIYNNKNGNSSDWDTLALCLMCIAIIIYSKR